MRTVSLGDSSHEMSSYIFLKKKKIKMKKKKKKKKKKCILICHVDI